MKHVHKFFFRSLTIGLLSLLSTSTSWAQTTIFTESFETDGNGTRYTTSVPEFTDGNTDFFTRTDGSNISAYGVNGQDATFYFAAQDIDAEVASSMQSLTFSSIDITGYSNLQFSALFAEEDDGSNQDWDDSDYVLVEYQIDGGGFLSLFAIRNDGSTFNSAPFIDTDFDGIGDGAEITDTFTSYGAAITGTGSSLDIRFTIDLNSGDEDIAFDFISVTGTPSGGGQSDFYVNATTGNDTNTGADFDNAFATFQKALDEAWNYSGSATPTIYISEGTYTPSVGWDIATNSATTTARFETFNLPDGIAVYGGFSDGLTGTVTQADIDARNFTMNPTVLSGDLGTMGTSTDNAYHVVYARSLTTTTVIDGLTIRDGRADGMNPNNDGGGFYNDKEGSQAANIFKITNVRFEDNYASDDGAGLYNNGMNSSRINVDLADVYFINNQAVDNGGGIYNCGRLTGGFEITVVNGAFEDNQADQGAGVYNAADGSSIGVPEFNILNSTFYANLAATSGGGIYNELTRGLIYNCVFWANQNGSWQNGGASSSNITTEHTLVQESQGVLTSNSGPHLGTVVPDPSSMIFMQDPLFTDPMNGDLTLTPCSPAINAGDQNLVLSPAFGGIQGSTVPVPAEDLAGNTRVQLGEVDMGAFESATTSSTPTVSVAVSPAQADEDTGGAFTYTFTADAAVCSDLTVTFTLTGSATFNDDYYIVRGATLVSGNEYTMIIPAGQTTGEVVFQAQQDAINEPDEDIIVTVVATP